MRFDENLRRMCTIDPELWKQLVRLLLETSGYSALLRGHEGVSELVSTADFVAPNPIVVGELLSRFMGGSIQRGNELKLRSFLSEPCTQTLAIDEETSERYAEILSALKNLDKPILTNDIWNAATAFEFGLTVVTLDRRIRHLPYIMTELSNGWRPPLPVTAPGRASCGKRTRRRSGWT
jgi:tRNA(fMet)-specific endonuclease VapC